MTVLGINYFQLLYSLYPSLTNGNYTNNKLDRIQQSFTLRINVTNVYSDENARSSPTASFLTYLFFAL